MPASLRTAVAGESASAPSSTGPDLSTPAGSAPLWAGLLDRAADPATAIAELGPNAADPISFADLEEASPFWRFANVAVAKGWMKTAAGRAFRPADPITTKELHRALVYAVGLRPAARALNRIRTADGERFPVRPTFGTNVLALRLNLRHATKWEDHDVHPWTPLPRVQVAYSLYRAATQAPSTIAWLVP